MDMKSFFGLHAFELLYLVVLAFLPFVVAVREVTYIILLVMAAVATIALFKYYLQRQVDPEGRVVLVSGCDTGFGNSIARRLDLHGFTIIAGCLDVNSDGANLLSASTSGRMNVVPLDITDENSVRHCMDHVDKLKNGKGLWALINNAGVANFGNVEFCPLDMYRRVMEVNIFGTIRLTKMCLPAVRASKGRVITVTGATGKLSPPGQSPLCMSSFALEAFTDSLRLEMKPFGVRVVTIRPGSYFGTTGLLNRTALPRLEADFDIMKQQATDEKFTAYGANYLDRQFHQLTEMGKSSANNQLHVVSAMERAVRDVKCQSQYLVDGANQLIDYGLVLLRLRPFLPSDLHDKLVARFYTMKSLTDDDYERQEDNKVRARIMN